MCLLYIDARRKGRATATWPDRLGGGSRGVEPDRRADHPELEVLGQAGHPEDPFGSYLS